jgi:hypothetical protein
MRDNPYESPRTECEHPDTFVEAPNRVLTAAFVADERSVFFSLLGWVERNSRLHSILAGVLVASFLVGILGYVSVWRPWSIMLMVTSVAGTLGITICFVIPLYITRTFLLLHKLRHGGVAGGPNRYQVTLKPNEIVLSTPTHEAAWPLETLSISRTPTLCVIQPDSSSLYPVPMPRSSFVGDESFMTFCATLATRCKDRRSQTEQRRT